MKIPAITITYTRGSVRPSRIEVDDPDGNPVDLTKILMITEVGRAVRYGDLPIATITVVGRLVEFEETAEPQP